MLRGMSEALLICPKCGGERTRAANKRGYVCVSCERERKRTYAKQMKARRKEQKSSAVLPPREPEPVPALDPELERDSAVILALSCWSAVGWSAW
jgi:hypothetical protein